MFWIVKYKNEFKDGSISYYKQKIKLKKGGGFKIITMIDNKDVDYIKKLTFLRNIKPKIINPYGQQYIKQHQWDLKDKKQLKYYCDIIKIALSDCIGYNIYEHKGVHGSYTSKEIIL